MHICTYNNRVEFEWDASKARLNVIKHGIDFSETVAVFEDELAITIPDDSTYEDRFITLGMDMMGRILVIVYTYRGENIRIISARKASSKEIRQYKGK